MVKAELLCTGNNMEDKLKMLIPERLGCGADPDMSGPWCLCLSTFGRVVTDGSGGIRARFISLRHTDADPLMLVFLEDTQTADAIVTPDPDPNPAKTTQTETQLNYTDLFPHREDL